MSVLFSRLRTGTLCVTSVTSPPPQQPQLPPDRVPPASSPLQLLPPLPSHSPPALQPQPQPQPQALPVDAATLSNTNNLITLPCPALYSSPVDDRIGLFPDSSGLPCLRFVGGQGLQSVLAQLDLLRVFGSPVWQSRNSAKPQGYSNHDRVLLYGTPAWGEARPLAVQLVLQSSSSSIVAQLRPVHCCLLERHAGSLGGAAGVREAPRPVTPRVVFIAGCKDLLESPFRTMQAAVHAAFANADDSTRKKLGQGATLQSLAFFCDEQTAVRCVSSRQLQRSASAPARHNCRVGHGAAVPQFLSACRLHTDGEQHQRPEQG